MKYVLGIDTSNYTTSAAVCRVEDMEIVANNKRLLEVKNGECGLRQSDAVFQHIKNFDEASAALRDSLAGIDGEICAVGVSGLGVSCLGVSCLGVSGVFVSSFSSSGSSSPAVS